MGNVESDAQMRLKVAPCVKADTLDRETIAGNQKVKKIAASAGITNTASGSALPGWTQ